MNMTVASFRCFVENENIQQNGVLRFTLYHVFQKTLHQSLVLVCTELFSLTFAIVGQLRKAIPNQTSAGYRVSVLKDGARQQRNATRKNSLFRSAVLGKLSCRCNRSRDTPMTTPSQLPD